MSEICAYLMHVIGADLTAVGATHFRDLAMAQEQVCIFSVSQHRIAVPYSRRDGISCFISSESSVPDESYEQWETIWSALGMTKDVGTSEGLTEFLRQFPDDRDEMTKLIGSRLREYFSRMD